MEMVTISSSSVSSCLIPAAMPPFFITSRLWDTVFKKTLTSLSINDRLRALLGFSGAGARRESM